ncbi:conserved hypothetical protein [Frankia sp. AiPs1]|uniref:SCO2524 family protein n=1 Tax=Frankia sp. AiPa1 TaxID=573492 RepID=UPI00202B2B25|nr:SCO2524 family protein [Frankia sp. AiPa1]MCL9758214.1 SCO2524 family protein [Frankia sp. AiPa1]
MDIQPRKEILNLWRAATQYSFADGQWNFGGRAEPNSTGDAEQLVCLLYPATAAGEHLRLETPDVMAKDVVAALEAMGEPFETPERLLNAVSDFMARYSDEDGVPFFHGGSYLQAAEEGDKLTDEQLRVDIVDSMSMSVTLCLSALTFIKEYRGSGRIRASLRQKIGLIELAASRRLTAAMVGLLRSFTVNAFAPGSPAGQVLLRLVSQDGLDEEELIERLHESLAQVRVNLKSAEIGTAGLESLENENHLFECGWSWGIVAGAAAVELDGTVDPEKPDRTEKSQPDGRAIARPNLYFTLTAMEGIADLFSPTTTVSDVLSNIQQTLVQSLRQRYELARQYWATLAAFGRTRSALADIPWQPTYRSQGELPVNDHYYTLQVAGLMIESLAARNSGDPEMDRIADVLAELAIRSRVTRRTGPGEAALAMHVPGLRIRLTETANEESPVVWPVADFSTSLLKRALRLASLADGAKLRKRLLDLVDEIWEHVAGRVIVDGPGVGLWDDPSRTFRSLKSGDLEPSWYYTERVMECLTMAVSVIDRPPVVSGRSIDDAYALYGEADHLYHQQLLNGALNGGSAVRRELEAVGIRIRQARAMVESRPGTAQALLFNVLKRLAELELSRDSQHGTVRS